MTCKKCNNSFPATILLEGKKRNLSNRKFCLECSPFNQHNTSPNLERKVGTECFCQRCKKVFIYKRNHGMTTKLCQACVTTSRHRSVKKKAVELKGGCCEICGYDRCLSALDFHHKDPATKEFIIGGSYNRSWNSLEKELAKCILVCRNCHSEIHEGLIPV